MRLPYGGEQTLSEIEKWRADAMLVDINMSVLDSIAVAQRNGGDVRPVEHSAFPRAAVGNEAGFDASVSKPAAPLQLALAIRKGRCEHNVRSVEESDAAPGDQVPANVERRAAAAQLVRDRNFPMRERRRAGDR